jgi:alpha-galactosidase
MDRMTALHHIRAGGTSLIVDSADGRAAIAYWGPDLGMLDHEELEAIAEATSPHKAAARLDEPRRVELVPTSATGWFGLPGVQGSRLDGTGFSHVFLVTDTDAAPDRIALTLRDALSGLALRAEYAIDAAGLIRAVLAMTNEGEDHFRVDALSVALPLPGTAQEILQTTGRHLKERTPERHALTHGRHVRESRRGRPGLDATLFVAAGEAGFGFESGRACAAHLAWSGNGHITIDRMPARGSVLLAGEVLESGEVVLAPGETYVTPEVYVSWGDGLNAVSRRFHDHLRARPTHPRRARPITLNTWEAVYFAQTPGTLMELADAAASLGVERYVVDDGWFLGRRNDRRGLGDWHVDPDVWPDRGLHSLADRVRAHGMELGLWFEPEMANPDSEVVRQHPEWVTRVPGRAPLTARHQVVLNLARSDVQDHLFERIDAIVREYGLAYLKWDHNRDVTDPADAESGRGTVHAATVGLYSLLARLKRAHPELEIESCASGGGRVDLGILRFTDRVWGSDAIDAVDRLGIQKYTGVVLPPELIGAHVGAATSHATGRTHVLDFRAAVAVFGHFGIEWDIRDLEDGDRERLAQWASFYREWRGLIHSGVMVHADLADPAADLRGVVAADGSTALFARTQVSTSVDSPPDRVRLPGLDPERRYDVRMAGPSASSFRREPVLAHGLSGLALAEVGMEWGPQRPETTAFLLARSLDDQDAAPRADWR